MDRFASMSVFVNVVEKGSFAAAADESGMTPTMVGNHIRSLETHLGIRLLTRTTRRQALTETGKDYYQQCLKILALVGDAEVEAREMRSRPRGRLRVTAPISFGTVCLAPLLIHYTQENPEVSLELTLDDRVIDIAKEGFDAAIRIGALPDSSNLTARPLRPWRRILCASPSYLDAHGEPTTLDELATHRCLCFGYPQGPEREYRLISKSGEARIARVEGYASINNGHALLAAAQSGLGIILQPESLVSRDLEEGRLVHILQDWSTTSSSLHIVYLIDRQMTPKLRHFIQFVGDRFG
ncbi:DNA-binding transcriptional LysR family regulator [Nitrobacteraceae bacterium AZCC 2146]